MDLMTLAKDYFLEQFLLTCFKQALEQREFVDWTLLSDSQWKNIQSRLHQLLEQWILNGRIVVNHDFINFGSN